MNKYNNTFFVSIGEIKRTISIAAKFTEELTYDFEYGIAVDSSSDIIRDAKIISDALQSAISSPAVFDAICRLTDAGVLNADEMEKLGICEKVKGSK